MSDADSSQPRSRNLRRNKIIIRKCKKPSKSEEPKTTDEAKKVNGEFSNESKNKENDAIEVEDDVQPKEIKSKDNAKGKKRKMSTAREDDEIIIIEDSTINEEKVDDENESGKEDSSVEVKGLKKRILAKTDHMKDPHSEISDDVKNGSNEGSMPQIKNSNKKPKVVRINRVKKKNVRSGKKRIEGEDDPQQESQAEYAQYLGLQPTMQFKCYRCGEKGFPSMLALNMHQRSCGNSSKGNFIANLQQDSSPSSSDPNMLTNFRITRKVYLCSACGTYYENWNLFLHMRDVHKKHICLFCLTMFGMAEKLADHLKNTHTISEGTFKSSEEFQNTYKGSCYLICCTCENLFNERGDYFHHQCVKRDPTAKCNLCGVKCGHYYTCPNSNQPRTLPAVTQPTTVPKTQSSILPKQTVGVSKNKASEELWMGSNETSFHDDDYDISHAASFCHVDIDDESGEKDKTGTKENPVDISDDENQNSKPVETKLIRQESNDKKDNDSKNKSNKFSESETTKSKIKSALENILSKTSPEKDKNGNKSKEEDIESVEQPTNEECDSNSSDKEDIEDVIGVKQSKEPFLKINVDTEDEKEQSEDESLDIPTTNDHLQDSSSKEQNVEQEKVQDSKSGSGKPVSSPHKDNDVMVSDSDDEPVTHLSGGQDDSESSSDDEKVSKKTQDRQTVDRQDVIDKSDNDKSSLAINEETNNLQNSPEDTNNTSKEDESRNDNSEELNSAVFDETSKNFNLEDVIGVNGPVENGEEDKSSESISPDQSQTESEEINDGIALAGEEVPAMALTLEDKLDEASSQSVVKECVRTSCLNCVYCSHAIKIAVNGKHLALHLLAEHRYKPVKNNETSQDVVNKLKGSLNQLESIFFNTDSYDSSDKSLNTPYDYTYECFQCRYVTKIHKELYVHKRKMHQKTVLLCVMCKSNFYSYSELLCHMCPGIYASGDISFRCLFCNLDMIPSAFRLMVHLRKGHHTCDICLDIAGDQQKLSAHMWKHKLNHLCYRCGIAYRNKPDITKHLFWKHGTESVLCKKCLQKKWPHVYHFCIPPTVFICEECNASFTKAVALKVHKRFHTGEFPYPCDECDQHFVSRKILEKHELSHNQPPPKENLTANKIDNQVVESPDGHINVESIDEPVVRKMDGNLKENEDKKETVSEVKTKKKKRKDKDRKGKAVLDVYDLPPLNLSSESDSSDEESRLTTSEITKESVDSPETKTSQAQLDVSNEKAEATATEPSDENQLPAPVVDGVWDNFHSYKAELEKRESKDLSLPNILPSTSSTEPNNQTSEILCQPEIPDKNKSVQDWTQIDHNYCLVPGKPKTHRNEEEQLSESSLAIEASTEVVQGSPAPRGHSSSIDHAYATLNNSSGEVNNATSAEEPPSLDMTPTSPKTVPPAESQPSSKKKPKTPKKKKHDISTQDSSIGNHSSTSSDSSSDSDSSCSCVSNCSCSDSSSSSSTSSSSGSDSSTSEGRRKAAARREKKKERLKHKSHKEDSTPTIKVLPPLPPEEEDPIVDIPVEPVEVPIRESDLDTDVSSTEEDFYDKYPQSHTKELPIKRDLMLLASVAPVNNGTVSPPPPPPVEQSPQTSTSKRKVKTKKRKKSQQSKKSASKMHQQTQAKPSTSIIFPMASSSPSQVTNYHNQASKVASPLRTPASTIPSDTAGSGSENDSARSSKRKRVRNKFYGYSSEDEFKEKTNVKWKKAETNIEPFPPPPPVSSYQPPTTHKPQVTIVPPTRRPKSSESSGSDDEPRLRIKKEDSSNSSSTESETEFDSKSNVPKEQQTEKSDNLYCYCQCPYDEVSEMIACDGQDCTIEWFHFECVGIMVPPKGKWYCPDCRKRRDLM